MSVTVEELDFDAVWWQELNHGTNITDLHLTVWTAEHRDEIKKLWLPASDHENCSSIHSI